MTTQVVTSKQKRWFFKYAYDNYEAEYFLPVLISYENNGDKKFKAVEKPDGTHFCVRLGFVALGGEVLRLYSYKYDISTPTFRYALIHSSRFKSPHEMRIGQNPFKSPCFIKFSYHFKPVNENDIQEVCVVGKYAGHTMYSSMNMIFVGNKELLPKAKHKALTLLETNKMKYRSELAKLKVR